MVSPTGSRFWPAAQGRRQHLLERACRRIGSRPTAAPNACRSCSKRPARPLGQQVGESAHLIGRARGSGEGQVEEHQPAASAACLEVGGARLAERRLAVRAGCSPPRRNPAAAMSVMSSGCSWPRRRRRDRRCATRMRCMALTRDGSAERSRCADPVNDTAAPAAPSRACRRSGRPRNLEAAEGQPQEQHAVGDQADHAAGQHRQHQAARLQRRVDREVGELGEQERRGRGERPAAAARRRLTAPHRPRSAASADRAARAGAAPCRAAPGRARPSARPTAPSADGRPGPTAAPAPGRGRAAARRPCRHGRSSSWRWECRR